MSTVNTAGVGLDSTSLSIDATTGIISLQSINTGQVGTHSATVTVKLVSYPSITLALTSFTITIQPCIVTSAQVV